MIPVPLLIKSPDGSHKFYNGVVFPVPAELRDNLRIAQYLRLPESGWSTDDFGYHAYAKPITNGGVMVLPALELTDAPRPRRRFHKSNANLNRAQVEALASSYLTLRELQEKDIEERERILVHDLRGISKTIYHNAQAAQDLVSMRELEEAGKRLTTLLAARTMLKIRIDAVDFEGNRTLATDSYIEIYKKVDKVARCFKELALSQSKAVYFGGSSNSYVFGPDILELVPYALVDNAVKYSPKGGQVNVSVHDGVGDVRIVVTSLGPKIRRNEQDRIFEKGSRGLAAREAGFAGSGLGLDMARRIVSQMFKGSIYVQQSQSLTQIDGSDYYETTFTVSFPTVSPRYIP